MDYNDFKCKWIDKEDLWQFADDIRATYWPEDTVPVDTEKIVELRLKLNVEPRHGVLSLIDMDAWLRTDLSGIVVDHDCYMKSKFANRMRFSFAHELGHYFLHRDMYSKLPFSTPEEWIDFMINAPENEYESFEWQANEFAGRFLVPRKILETKIEEVCKIIKDKNLISYLAKDPDAVLSRVSPRLREIFGVSEEVIQRRVQRENLWPPKF